MVRTQKFDLDTDTTLGGNNASDYIAPSQKAIKDYVDNHSGGGGITVDSALSTTSENPVQNKVITGALNDKADDSDVIKKSSTAQQTISLSSGTGTTSLGVKSRSASSSYISFSGSSAWLGSIGVNSSKKPVFYNGTGYTLATTDDIPDISGKQDTLVSGTNIKTINGNSLLGSGNIEIQGGTDVDTALSTTSTNPVQNKVINSALSGKYDASNPNGYTSNVGTVTKVNNTSPDSSGNVTLSIPAAQIQSDWTQTTTTAKDYIKNKPNLATVATSGSYNDLSNKPTIPSVGNGTLTIQKNGGTVKTFTANSSSNVTANITVPTKTSELTNDSGYTTNTGTVTSVNNVSPVNGNVSLTIPSVGNGTITITQGGTTKGTFTTNQSSNATIALDAGGGTATDVQINGTSIVSNNVANIVTNTAYNASSNKIATMADVPTIATSVSSSSTNSETVGAKLFYDTVGDIETLLSQV